MSSTGEGESHRTPIEVDSNQTPTPNVEDNPEVASHENNDLNDNGKRNRSMVWDHFKKQKIDGKMKAICNYCNKKLGGESKNGTTHLHDHYKSCIRRKTSDIKQSILNPSRKVEGKTQLNTYTFDQDMARDKLAKMIILHEYPLQMVEHYGFREYSNSLQPLFKVPSRNTIKKDILKIFEHERERTMDLFRKNRSRFAITTDMWTSTSQKRGFMAVTAHFIDDSWHLQSRIVRFIYVPCPHTSEVLSEALIDCLMEWNIDLKLSTLTLDNCSTNDAMVNILLDKLPCNALLLGGEVFHMRCSAHILNLIVKDGLDVIGDAIEKVRDSVAYWTATPKRGEKFEKVAGQLDIPYNKKLVLDCKTRWNSTYVMLHTALEYKDVFARLKLSESQYKGLPSEEDWMLASEICERLEIFYEVTLLFSGTKYPTANLFFPKICEIRASIKEWISSSYFEVRVMATSMITKFEKYWSSLHGIMAIGTILDPRFKMKGIEFYFPLIYGDEATREIEKVRKLCFDMVKEYQSSEKSNTESRGRGESSSVSSSHSQGKTRLINAFDLFVSSTSTSEHVKSELEYYLEESVLPRNDEFDLLAWWKSNGLKYPTLLAIARDVLAIPVSTVASESAFSTSGRFLSPHRSRLHPKTLEALMCAQDWLWAEIQGAGFSATDFVRGSINDDEDRDEEGSCVTKA